jgi:hypothetical protein
MLAKAFVATIFALCAVAPAAERVKLVFSIDQGFGSGIVVNRDTAALSRIIAAVKTLQARYDVHALFNPQVADRGNLDALLDLLVAADLPFVFDVYTSDAMTLGTSTKFNAPADGPHGIAISMKDLAAYKERYRKHLAGLRIMEVFSQDFTVRAIRTTNPEWKGAGWQMPADEFFQYRFAEPFVRFARDQKMFVQWSDAHWFTFAGWDKPQEAHEKILRRLLGEFPGVVIVTYANNEPEEKSLPRLNSWQSAVEGFVADGASGFGLSNQSWMHKEEWNCPIGDIIAWTQQARKLQCRLIQFEPSWYFFALPGGSFGREDYTKDSLWKNAGTPRATFEELKRVLLDD